MNNPLLSIVIATKNRQRYCIEAIKSIMNLSDECIELVVSDNSETDVIRDYISNNNDHRLKYRYDKSEISSIENFNRAMELSTGEYVCLIGDDDTVLPIIVHAAKWAKKYNIDSLSSNNYIHYYWPGALKNYDNGLLLYHNIRASLFQVNIRKELQKLISNGIVNYVFYNLPKTYHGIVKREIMLKVREETGNFYGGLSPDIYSLIAVSCFAKNHFSTSVPLTIAGVCGNSTSAQNFTGDHAGKIESIPHLKNRGNYTWDENVAEYYSVSTIWAESGLKALKELKENKLYNSFNIYPHLAQGILMNRKFILKLAIEKSLDLRKSKQIPKIIFYLCLLKSIFNIIIDKFIREINYKFINRRKKITSVKSIQEAIELIKGLQPYKGS